MIKIATVCGSVRENNSTNKALNLVHDEIRKHADIELEIINAANYHLTLPGANNSGSDYKEIDNVIREATGVILATPEYHGSYSSVMKLIIDNLGYPSSLARKPVALLGVAAGQIGAIKALEHLRSVCSHVGSIVLPGPVSIPNVRTSFDEDGNCLDPKIEKNVRGLVLNLMDYIKTSICPPHPLEEMVREQA